MRKKSREIEKEREREREREIRASKRMVNRAASYLIVCQPVSQSVSPPVSQLAHQSECGIIEADRSRSA